MARYRYPGLVRVVGAGVTLGAAYVLLYITHQLSHAVPFLTQTKTAVPGTGRANAFSTADKGTADICRINAASCIRSALEDKRQTDSKALGQANTWTSTCYAHNCVCRKALANI